MKQTLIILLLFSLIFLAGCQDIGEVVSSITENIGQEHQVESVLREKDDMEMVLYQQSIFSMGESGEDINGAHSVFLDAFFIDRHEVTNQQYAKCVEDGACTPPYASKSATNPSYYGNADFEDYPVIYVNWDQANEYCNWAGGQLPTEAQWEKAAQVLEEDEVSRFPWGNDPFSCSFANADDCFTDTTEVGSLSEGNTPSGISDLSGNVMEWVSDWYAADYYQDSPYKNPAGPINGETRVVRGGAWNTSKSDTYVYARSENYPNLMGNNIGFRCAVTAESELWDSLPKDLETSAVESDVAVAEALETSDPVVIWNSGTGPEQQDVLNQIVDEFNMQGYSYEAIIEFPAEDATIYREMIMMGAAASELPCIINISERDFYQFVWDGQFMPIGDYLSPDLLNNVFPSVLQQGTMNGQLYSLNPTELGMALSGNRTLLERAGIRIPESVDEAWTLAEFETALAQLQALDEVEHAMEMHLSWSGAGYYVLVMPPLLQSFGGDLVDRTSYQASGVLDSAESVEALQALQRWVDLGYVGYDLSSFTDYFEAGTAGLEWGVSWMHSYYKDSLGDDLVVIPMPDFGTGIKTSTSDNNWVISRTCENPGGAIEFLEFLMNAENTAKIAQTEDSIPANWEAIDASLELYGPGSEFYIYIEQFEQEMAVTLPTTPAQQIIQDEFFDALERILNGEDVSSTLSAAAEIIDQRIDENHWDQ